MFLALFGILLGSTSYATGVQSIVSLETSGVLSPRVSLFFHIVLKDVALGFVDDVIYHADTH